jgi:hypothetical protein
MMLVVGWWESDMTAKHTQKIRAMDSGVLLTAYLQMTKNAEKYLYAEDLLSLQRGGSLKKWPNSKYVLPPFGNNSNSFVRFMLKQVDIAIPDPFLNTFEHPGAYFPSPVSDTRAVPTYDPHW